MKQLEVLTREKIRNEGCTEVELNAEIRCHAYALYELRGKVEGHALDDWIQAEKEVQQPERSPNAA